MAGEPYADKFNDFNPDGIFGNHSSLPFSRANDKCVSPANHCIQRLFRNGIGCSPFVPLPVVRPRCTVRRLSALRRFFECVLYGPDVPSCLISFYLLQCVRCLPPRSWLNDHPMDMPGRRSMYNPMRRAPRGVLLPFRSGTLMGLTISLLRVQVRRSRSWMPMMIQTSHPI